jgi:Tol biopolymer transport system component
LASDRQGNWDLYALPWPAGGALQPLTDTPGTHEIAPDWHPTRPEVLVYSARPIDDQAWEMRLIDTRRGGYTTLGPGLYPRWSADGSKLVFQRARSREPRLYSVWIADVRFDERGNVDMGLPTEIVGGKEWAAVNPVFGPADRVIFASVGRSLEARQGPETLWRGDDLWSIRTDGTDLQRLTTSPAADHEPSWAPALQRVFYTSFRAGSANIWSLPVPGEQP